MEFSGKTALVTGGSRGIGKGVAIELARKGAYVIVNFTANRKAAEDTVQEIENCGGKGEIVKFDVSNFSDVQEIVGKLVKKFDGIEILVNNAGITCDGLFLRMGEGDWDKVFNVNLKGVFNCTKAVIRDMSRKRYGRIVNITSVVGEMGNVGQVNYSSTKAGILGFTKSMAKEFGSRGITVNAVSPGFIDTDITKNLPNDLKKKYMEVIPLKRFGKTEDVSGVVCFLVSDNASYITGEVIRVNGGLYV